MRASKKVSTEPIPIKLIIVVWKTIYLYNSDSRVSQQIRIDRLKDDEVRRKYIPAEVEKQTGTNE